MLTLKRTICYMGNREVWPYLGVFLRVSYSLNGLYENIIIADRVYARHCFKFTHLIQEPLK